MARPLFSTKFRVLITSILSFGLLSILMLNYPINFVQKEDLNYSTGIFEIVDAGAPTNYVGLRNADNKNSYMVFSCSYTPFGNEDGSSCGDKKNLEPYDSQKVTIGWYEIDEFLGSKNDMPQLVSIETDDKVMRSFDDTYTYIRKIKHGILFFLGPLFLC